MTEPIDSKAKAPALDKGLDIIEFMTRQSEPQSIYDISRGLNRTRGEVYRMLNRLVERGYLEKSGENDKVLLSNKLFSLAVNRNSTEHLIETANPVMSQLRDQTNMTFILSVRSSLFAVTIHNVAANSRITLSSPIGSRIELWKSAPGIAILSRLPESELLNISAQIDSKEQHELTQASSFRDNHQQYFRKTQISALSGEELAVAYPTNIGGVEAAISCIVTQGSDAVGDSIGDLMYRQLNSEQLAAP